MQVTYSQAIELISTKFNLTPEFDWEFEADFNSCLDADDQAGYVTAIAFEQYLNMADIDNCHIFSEITDFIIPILEANFNYDID